MTIPEFFSAFPQAHVWVTGSHMYGMNTADSDVDFTAVFHNPKEFRNPLVERDVTHTNPTNDLVAHSATKFARLVVKGNFNTLDLLFHRAEQESAFVYGLCHIMRPHAITQNSARAYMGYVMSQRGSGLLHPRPQSPTRKLQVETLGYDPKFAAHLLRGMYSLMHILDTGEYYTLSKDDREFLVEVKTGQYTKPLLEDRVEDFMVRLEDTYAKKLGNLPTPAKLEEAVREFFYEYA